MSTVVPPGVHFDQYNDSVMPNLELPLHILELPLNIKRQSGQHNFCDM